MIDILLVTTLIVSISDVLINLGTLCCSGRTKIKTKNIEITHSEYDKSNSLDSEEIEKITRKVHRRMSC